jgi:hypothetical protein
MMPVDLLEVAKFCLAVFMATGTLVLCVVIGAAAYQSLRGK